jgi:hypothetical protein
MEGEIKIHEKIWKKEERESPRNLLDINIKYGGVGTSLTSTRTCHLFKNKTEIKTTGLKHI